MGDHDLLDPAGRLTAAPSAERGYFFRKDIM
jgi:hypothetical protein